MLGELSQKYPAESTENANAEEKTVSREELVKNVNKAQDAYDIAEEEYNASKTLVESYKAEMDSYAASRNGCICLQRVTQICVSFSVVKVRIWQR